jgi:hypothetical protein
MNLKTMLIALFLCLLAVSLAIGVHTVNADSNGSITFAGGITLFSPVNETCNSNYLTLNLNLTCGAGIQFLLTYSIDGTTRGSIPLTYNGSAGFQLFAVETGTVPLPRLPSGSHQLTIYEEACLNNYHGANPPGAPFKPTSPGSDNYTVSWTDTVNFSIAPVTQPTPSPTPAPATTTPTDASASSVPELSWLLMVPLLLFLFSVAVIVGHRKQVKKL